MYECKPIYSRVKVKLKKEAILIDVGQWEQILDVYDSCGDQSNCTLIVTVHIETQCKWEVIVFEHILECSG